MFALNLLLYLSQIPYTMKTFKLKSQFDDLDLGVALCECEEQPKAIFQIVHGMAEHKERYFPFMEYLAEHGYVSVIHDHRGHGESVKSEKDYGYMYEGGAQAMVEDVLKVQDWAKSQYPGVPVHLFGHSMGSMVVRAFVRSYDDHIAKLIVCGCPSDNPGKGAGLLLANIIGFFRGQHHQSAFLNNLAFGGYARQFPGEHPLAWLSANKENVKNYAANPLCGFTFTVNGFKNLFRIMKICYSKNGWVMRNTDLKILFISGGDDPCRIDDKAFYKAVNFLKAKGYKSVDSILYPGLRHEIMLENEPKVQEDILKFIEG